MKSTKMQILDALKNNSFTVIAMITAYHSPYSERIGSQLTTSSHVVYNACRYAAIPLAHALAHARYLTAHKGRVRSGGC